MARGTKNKVSRRVVSVAKNYKFGSRQGTVEVATLQKLTMMFFLLFAFSHAASTALVYPDLESGVRGRVVVSNPTPTRALRPYRPTMRQVGTVVAFSLVPAVVESVAKKKHMVKMKK